MSTFMVSTYARGATEIVLWSRTGGGRPENGENGRVRKPVAAVALLTTVILSCSGQRAANEAGPPEPTVSPGATMGRPTATQPDRNDKGENESGKNGPAHVDPPKGFRVLSAKAWLRCTAGPPLRGGCPTVVPRTRRNYLVETFGRPGGRFGVVEMAAGAPSDDHSKNKPPAFAHVVVEAGRPAFLIDLGPAATERDLSDELLQGSRPGAVDLGERTWGGWRGRLFLAEAFPGGGAHGDHLVFEWRRRGVIHRISLHTWVPTGRAEAMLKTIVASTSG